ncbi:MAG: endonuclease/exonuclease/phosphatase family protein [Campylobacterota bacterium]|nr:endonuclease/exonuclease/phosphatase family protein [Campylobacterota bacterium]
MIKAILPLLICFSFLHSLEFKVASYNVENLFDMKYDGSEYKEYIPHGKYWNKKSYLAKLNNISKVINELNSDILALQEVESKKALLDLMKKTNYTYYRFVKNRSSAVGLAVLSKFPIKYHTRIKINTIDKYSRDILKTVILVQNKPLIIYTNHWRSKKAKESKRIEYASSLIKDIDLTTKKNEDYIILGDLNSNYNEFETFKYDRKLNDTYGITAINQLLNTTINGNFVSKSLLLKSKKRVHYNLWLELEKSNRYSSIFRSTPNTPDNMIISRGLLDNKNISYINKSFNKFDKQYLYRKNNIYRWNKFKSHGYSDHLPIYAIFTTNITTNKSYKEKTTATNNTISQLYKIQTLNKDIQINNVIVLYTTDKIAVIKQSNDRAIMIYNPSHGLKEGFIYDINVHQIDTFNRLKEIKEFSIISKNRYDPKFNRYYLDGNKIDLFDQNYQNEIVTNLSGIYKKGYLYLNKNKKIKLYFKEKSLIPKHTQSIKIKRAHLSVYKSKIQLTVYSKDDIY